MSNDPQLRLAGPSDAEILLDFMRSYYTFDGHVFDAAKARLALAGFLRDANFGRAWLIQDGHEPVGYVVLCFGYSLEWLGRDAFIDEIYLREDYRRRGWGRKAMAFVEGEARRDGNRALHLEVVHKNVAALELYRKLGFREHNGRLLTKWIATDFEKPRGRSRP